MTNQELRAQVELLLGSAQVESALDTLASYVEQNGPLSVREDVISLRSKYISIREDYELRGILSRSEYEIQTNKVTFGIFALLRRAERKSSASPVVYWKWLVGTGVASVIAFFLWQWIASPSPAKTAVPQAQAEKRDTLTVVKPPVRILDATPSGPQLPTSAPAGQARLQPSPSVSSSAQPASPQTYTVKIVLDSEWWGADILVDGQEATILSGSSQGIRLVEVAQKNSAHLFTARLRSHLCDQKVKITQDSSMIRFASNCQ